MERARREGVNKRAGRREGCSREVKDKENERKSKAESTPSKVW